ncbi:MAG: 2-C-methyl-D-erythritol 2,4-cyclodiphosphate synthase [Phycisphaerales bacterium]|jgi:2-C-methyl-D-erythritol 2,4-cyclodiphosphate synthase
MAPTPDPHSSTPGLPSQVRIGHGYDLHRLETPENGGRPLILGGVFLPHDPSHQPKGPVAHSDGDALYHAVTDALLGAIGDSDIGMLFPNTDPRHEAEDSQVYLAEAVRRVHDAGLVVINLDATVLLERPKLSPHKGPILANMKRVLACDNVNIKGKTGEGLGPVGEGRAVEVHAVVLLGPAS